MARPPTGQIIRRAGQNGTVKYGIRFRSGGKRHYVTLDVETLEQAKAELKRTLALVELGMWQPPAKRRRAANPDPVLGPDAAADEPTFHRFASEWLEERKPELGERTYDDYRWALTHHLLPFFGEMPLAAINARDVDRYKAVKLAEGVLSANTLNKTITRLAQILGLAHEYNLIAGNPAVGKRRRAKATKPRRPWVEPCQLMTLLEAADKQTVPEKKVALLGGRGRPLLATLAGAGLRIDEALSLQRQHVNVAKGTLAVVASKTDAGVRTVDLPPALRDELATYLDGSRFKKPTDLVFPTSSGKKDNRQNIRQRLFMKAIERANVKLAEKRIEPLGDVRPHGLRRTYASLRTACGDDPVYVSRQIGHEDVRFTLNVYAQSVQRRERMTAAEQEEYDRAVEWASWASAAGLLGTNPGISAQTPAVNTTVGTESKHEKSPA
jgi:integrase